MTTFLKQRGGYRKLRVYQVTEIIYDITYYFTQHFLKVGDRTVDQMLQAARSGKQNIAEGSEAATTSIETEIKLTNVAKASLEELLIDYEDYLRVRNKVQWKVGHPRYEKVRAFACTKEISSKYSALLPKYDDESLANLCITLIHQASYLLRRLIEKQQEMFLQKGGIREQMSVARQKAKKVKLLTITKTL
nr:four helix bundle suffix domain-containing protein [Capnocytophaga sp.]